MGNGSTSAFPAAPPRLSPRDLAPTKITVVGTVGGALSGLLGVGGGVIVLPLLVLLLVIDRRGAHAASLGAIIPVSLVRIATYAAAAQIGRDGRRALREQVRA